MELPKHAFIFELGLVMNNECEAFKYIIIWYIRIKSDGKIM